jgi:acid phosphatase type 7
MRLQFLVASLVAAAVQLHGVLAASTQFHLSLVSDTSYMLDWVTPSTATSSVLLYGTSATALNQQIAAKPSGAVEQSAGASVACWTALLQNLKPGSTVYYALKGDDTTTPRSFTVPNKAITWAVFGDLAAPLMKQAAAVTLPALKKELIAGAFQGLINLGDLGYELVKQNGENYMDSLEDVGSKVPIQTTIGNHEHEHAFSPEFALQNYHRRFAGLTMGAGTQSGSYSNEFYSFNAGLIHFVIINTEIYGNEAFFTKAADGTWKADEAARVAMAKAQAAWLEYDLSRVDRTVTPYVVMGGHRPPFKTPLALSEPSNKFAKEVLPLISAYDVDLYMCGHEHTYMMFDESTYGSYRVPPFVVSGSPGNNEYIRPEKDLKIVGFKHRTIIQKYGFGYLTATETALEWRWGSAATDGSTRPQPADWTMEDSVSFPRRQIASPTEKKGTPVKAPEAIETQFSNTADSGANSGSKASSDPSSEPGTVAPADPSKLSSKLTATKPGAAASNSTTSPAKSKASAAVSLVASVGSALVVVAAVAIGW